MRLIEFQEVIFNAIISCSMWNNILTENHFLVNKIMFFENAIYSIPARFWEDFLIFNA